MTANKELKIRLADPAEAIHRLNGVGAMYLRDTIYEYTYFNQPEGNVLKLTKRGDRTFRTVIEREGDRFVIKSSDELSNPEEITAQLTKRYGVKRNLLNHRSFYQYKHDEISINNIERVGTFLIIESKNPQLSFITDTLGIKNPEIVKDSFDNL